MPGYAGFLSVPASGPQVKADVTTPLQSANASGDDPVDILEDQCDGLTLDKGRPDTGHYPRCQVKSPVPTYGVERSSKRQPRVALIPYARSVKRIDGDVHHVVYDSEPDDVAAEENDVENGGRQKRVKKEKRHHGAG